MFVNKQNRIGTIYSQMPFLRGKSTVGSTIDNLVWEFVIKMKLSQKINDLHHWSRVSRVRRGWIRANHGTHDNPKRFGNVYLGLLEYYPLCVYRGSDQTFQSQTSRCAVVTPKNSYFQHTGLS
jgi:hypothetical protein